MTRLVMMKKYVNVLGAIATAERCDLNVAYDKLKYMARNPKGEKYSGVPADFDYTGFLQDLAADDPKPANVQKAESCK